ncbi:endonuclease/exonuclease/phosphatase family protein [Thermococcus thioreducens]|uniref:Metal-dependent hydrolase n=1 Tax=Thermococcus thioreducens TaxID=277988 RepID=A0A0Q2S624_9EURY|nr:endonuclease/exonuclease/phosphatase family protein [Thermococcus thioreducens]ASJ13156.1 metal-dependent hydrolase [Thermococcus thioreducens]KQH82875.1 metal-dependent hydrolase [Thermococcus thioreducens]SEW20233.1 Metal-dependent hydrolase, endonuclease/exonuclease/phosphatase family [Thermococcus thioreducens]
MKIDERNRILLGLGTGVLLASSLRIFVAGAYSSLEKTFFYGMSFPSGLGILMLLIAAFLVGRMSRKAGAALTAAYATAVLITDATEYTHLVAAFALPVALALVKELDVKYLTMGLVADLSLRVLAVGAEPADFPYTRVILALFLFLGAYALWNEPGTLKKPGFGLYAFAALIELGLIYPNAVMRYSGMTVYYLPEFIGFSLLVALAILLGPHLARKPTVAMALLIIGSATLFLKPFSLVGLPIALASAIALVESAKGSRGGVIGAFYLFLVATLAIGAYVGRDIGLPFMEDRLEALILATSVIYALSAYGKNVGVSLPSAREIAGPLAGLTIASVIVLALFNAGPVYANAKKDVLIWTYNVHQGFGPYDGTFNGYELVNLLSEQRPDIWLGQEVVGGMIANAYQDVPLFVSAHLGYAYEYKPAVEGTYGIAVFSHWHMNTVGELNLESVGQARPAQKVSIDELGLTIVNVHMGLSEEERAMQAEELLKFAEGSPVAQIIAGDTNAEPDERAIEILTRDYRDAFSERPPYTFLWERNGVVDREDIDYILLKKDWPAEVKDYGCLCDVLVSDHRPVWAVIELP